MDSTRAATAPRRPRDQVDEFAALVLAELRDRGLRRGAVAPGPREMSRDIGAPYELMVRVYQWLLEKRHLVRSAGTAFRIITLERQETRCMARSSVPHQGRVTAVFCEVTKPHGAHRGEGPGGSVVEWTDGQVPRQVRRAPVG